MNIGDTAPEIKLPDSLGKWRPLSEVKAKIVLLDFWAAWCGPCIQAMPQMKQIYQRYKEKGLVVYAVSLDKDYRNWVATCRRLELPFVLVNEAYGMQGQSAKNYGVTAIPKTFLIQDGKLIAKDKSLSELESLIDKLLE
jgi:thiol-disulfide isomerase/thioredoxin